MQQKDATIVTNETTTKTGDQTITSVVNNNNLSSYINSKQKHGRSRTNTNLASLGQVIANRQTTNIPG